MKDQKTNSRQPEHKIDTKQLRSDLINLTPEEFKAKYQMEISELKDLTDTQLESRVNK